MEAATRNDEDRLLAIMRDKLYTAVVSDVLDSAGLHRQALASRLRPIAPTMRVIGRAHTVLTADIYQRPSNPYRLEIEAVDALRRGDVMVAATNGSERTCFWGELLSTASIGRGAHGCIIDGHCRDALQIIELGFPVFCTGFRPVDSSSRSTVVDYSCPIECGGVLVNPGDIVFGDFDGIVIVPQDRLEEVVEAALAKVESENQSRDMLRQGALLREVYDRYGVL